MMEQEQARKQCWKCGREWPEKREPFRSEFCEGCDRAWRSCRNCRFYDPDAPAHCKIPDIELVRDIEMANFCDQFEMATHSGADPQLDNQRRQLDALLGEDDDKAPKIRF